MKVAFNTYPNTNQNVGGIQMRVKRTFKALRDAGVDVTLFDQWQHDLREFDILHTFKLHHSTLELVLTAHERGIRNIISTVLPPEYQVKMIRLFTHIWKRGVARNLQAYTLYQQAVVADALIAVSKTEAHMITQAYGVPDEQVHVVPNCADATLYGMAEPVQFKQEFHLPDYVLGVGRIEQNKNQLRLIRAIRRLGIHLVLVGRVSDGAGEYERQCREAGGDQVTFIDRLPYNSPLLASAYAGAMAFVLPSLSEIAPNSTLEAAMAGTRIVVTRNSLAAEEWFGPDAEYVNPIDEEDIANKLSRALNTPVNLGFRERILQNYSWEAGARHIVCLYQSLIGSGSPTPCPK